MKKSKRAKNQGQGEDTFKQTDLHPSLSTNRSKLENGIMDLLLRKKYVGERRRERRMPEIATKFIIAVIVFFGLSLVVYGGFAILTSLVMSRKKPKKPDK